MEKNVNMVTHINLFVKESAQHMQNTGNADLGRRCNLSHDVDGGCKREEVFGPCLFGI